MQLLDELRHKREAIEFQPTLDPDGSRLAALGELIEHYEDLDAEKRTNGEGHEHRRPFAWILRLRAFALRVNLRPLRWLRRRARRRRAQGERGWGQR